MYDLVIFLLIYYVFEFENIETVYNKFFYFSVVLEILFIIPQ